jgi:hypothetical protein
MQSTDDDFGPQTKTSWNNNSRPRTAATRVVHDSVGRQKSGRFSCRLLVFLFELSTLNAAIYIYISLNFFIGRHAGPVGDSDEILRVRGGP